ncbi:MAG TPA: PAS domain-containing sensor histidine kinase [Kofleriaceae bacterium]|jgi:PAS domain S-box-containing protein|nr:PAS domain-containing sensor histidine kinase [Kofleriaceae bacterium]
MMIPNLGAMLPALLEVLSYVGTGVTVIADRGHGLERVYVNEASAAMLGYTLDELRVQPVHEAISPEHRALLAELSAGFRAGKPVPPALEYTGIRKDGTLVSIELALSSFRIPDGIAYVMLLRDGSPHNQSRLSLLEADRIGLVGALAAGFAHEINNPLTSVLLNLRLLRRHLTTAMSLAIQPAALRCLDDIATGAERIASNVSALQSLATRRATAPIDLAAVVSAALRLAAPTLEEHAHVIRQIFPVRKVTGEESRIGQAVIAMLLFSSSGFDGETTNISNRIVVSVEQRDDDVVLEVSDNGRELTSEEADHAFDPFYRSSTRGASIGVGLGVARSVAATLGGEVTLAPRPGGGAVITMRLRASAP